VWPRGAAEILLGDDVDVEALLETASARRSTGATDLNEDSSRSHLVVILRMETAKFHSKLFLVDLAGCEQVRRSGAAGSRLDEACGINKSLSALGNVVAALTAAKAEDDLPASADTPAKKKGAAPHVPYRDSKLTFLLSEALGGNARAVLVTCLSPSVADAAETLSTLRFGVRARRIVARPKRNVNASPEKKTADADAAAAELAELRSAVATLRRRLEAVRNDEEDTRASSAKSTLGDAYPYVRVKPMSTFRLWVGLCVAYFAVDALVLWA
jgi:kinesin family protein 5